MPKKLARSNEQVFWVLKKKTQARQDGKGQGTGRILAVARGALSVCAIGRGIAQR